MSQLDDERMRQLWRTAGRFLLKALIAYGCSVCGYVPLPTTEAELERDAWETWLRMEVEPDKDRNGGLL
ncbi:MAG TPA: hypothetical protein VHZ97_02150 [Pseudonocardiaceae bacterium]|nr:hypothetical protein [Pseudonocardiaceae bacterium]